MATRAIGGFADGLVTFEVDYDASWRVTALRCVNRSGQAAHVAISRDGDGRSYAVRALPGTTSVAVPTGVAGRIVVALDAVRNRMTGFDRAMVWPYP